MKSEPILRFEGIVKRFPGVVALKGVNFELREGEVHVLVGANGAGKSTLVKILAGVYQPDDGRIFFDGKAVTMKSPEEALQMGISVVYQNFNLVGKMDVGQNIFLNREPLKGRLLRRLDWERIYAETRSVLERLHANIHPKCKIEDLPVADLQMVEIAKALAVRSRILVLDEPTSSLSEQETDELFSRISQLKEEGVAILYISHRLEEIQRIGDRVTVFRDGEGMGSGIIDDMSVEKIIKMMLGRDIKNIYPWRPRETGGEILSVHHLASSNAFSDVSFSLRRGEILGISGLVGAKRTELAHAIFGSLPIESGQVRFKGQAVEFRSPKDAIDAGIGLLPEDKAKHGMFEILSVASNVTSAGLKLLKKGLGLDLAGERHVVDEYKEKLRSNKRCGRYDRVFELSHR